MGFLGAGLLLYHLKDSGTANIIGLNLGGGYFGKSKEPSPRLGAWILLKNKPYQGYRVGKPDTATVDPTLNFAFAAYFVLSQFDHISYLYNLYNGQFVNRLVLIGYLHYIA